MDSYIVNNSSEKSGEVATLASAWIDLQGNLRTIFAEDVYRVWFEDLRPIRESDDELILLAPNEFAALWVRDNYCSILEKHLEQSTGRKVSIGLEAPPDSPRDEAPIAGGTISKIAQRKLNAIRKFDETYLINPKNTFDNFIVGDGNQLAQATCIAVASDPGKAYNPLFLYGATGLGKTHLLQAVAHAAIEKRPKLKVVYTSTEKFTNEFIKAVQENLLGKFREGYRKVDMLLIDDVHFLSGKERIQEEFFYTFNELFESQKQICLCSDRPAAEISRLENRLVSRFQWGFVADIQAPDLETRIAILRKKANDMRLVLPEEVLQLLAEGVSTNVRRLEGALTRVAGYVALTKRQIDVAETQRLLHDIFREEASRVVHIEQIQRRVAEYFKITLAELLGKKRPASIAFPRQVAMYLSRLLTTHSLQFIGNEFGGRDHGTVIHACKTVENAMEQDESVKKTIETLRQTFC
ncbi:MAG: chromosomal replication initiator protein DnaA [Puniceicoccales bacterium]|jgi:chromosomal replication initiator protein|nr:chromosomal replication initiator protein DnaA [Puniceicoccales bacterium]